MVGRIRPNAIEVKRGDNFTINLQLKGRNGYINLTGAGLKMQVRTRDEGEVVLTKQGIIDDAARGKAYLSLEPKDTKGLQAGGNYVTDIQMIFGNGEVHTIFPANLSTRAAFIVSPDVTE